MKIMAIAGSSRGEKGNTASLLNLVLDGAQNRGAKTETIHLSGGQVQPCRACDFCHKKGYCAQKDEFYDIRDKILDADALVLASPNYIFSVSAQLKAFLDRCCGVIHCMMFEGKYGASVITSGGGNEEPIADYMNHFLMTTGITPVGSIWATMSELPDYTFTEDIKNEAKNLGQRLVKAWKNKETYPEWESRMNEFRERMKSLMLWRKDEWPFEYEYWKSTETYRKKSLWYHIYAGTG